MHEADLQHYLDFLLSHALSLCGSLQDAEDLTQETLLCAMICLHSGGEIQHPKAYLLTVLRRKFYDLLRKRYHHASVIVSNGQEMPMDDEASSALIHAEEMEQLRREVASLSQSYRDILVRHYFKGEKVGLIARDLHLPEGTVKSRLDFGRKQVRKGFDNMKSYMENSYQPQRLHLSVSGSTGLNDSPVSLVPEDDVLAQNVLIMAYEKPVSITELSKAMGVAAAYIEPVIARLVKGELMKQMGDGRVYTDFILYRSEDHFRYVKEAEHLVEQHAAAYLPAMRRAMEQLHQTAFYSQRLERFMLIHIAYDALWNSMEKHRQPQVFPDRADGGRWIAFGTVRTEKNIPLSKQGKEDYTLSGLRIMHFEHCADGHDMSLYNYESSLYGLSKYDGFGYPLFSDTEKDVLLLIHMLKKGLDPYRSAINARILQAIPLLIECGYLKEGKGQPEVLIPCLTFEQFNMYRHIVTEAVREAAAGLEEPLAAYIRTHRKTIPSHLTSVPEQKLTLPYEPNAMMLVYTAIAHGLHPRDLGYPCPETVAVFD